MMILDCKDWDDDGDSSFLTRLGIGVFEYYTWLVIISTLSYGLYIPLLYPVEIKLFILEVMKHNETRDLDHSHGHLYLYRILTLLTTYQNNGWCQPSMPIVIVSLLLTLFPGTS
ncbi:hypothetical protein Fcan01_19275 [Folsomia candida]|uniref:Uncharacterized protein n=1 Tax=Folsomia candida TaxID=158441 RepID=A0A226DLE6_FOLCA|nr:hypothetical protein Fcan01_19275 [Folsomia candida]